MPLAPTTLLIPVVRIATEVMSERGLEPEFPAGVGQQLSSITGPGWDAFERQESQRVDGIERAQAARKFQAVDDLRLRLEADVLGAQVAVAFDDASPTHPCSQHVFVPHHGPVHAVEEAGNLRQIEARSGKHAAARGEVVAQALQVLVFADRGACR